MDLEKLVVKVMAETTDAQTKMKKIRDEVQKTAQKANSGLNSIGKNSGRGLGKFLNQIKTINNAVKGFGRKIQLGAGMIKPTQGFMDLTAKIIDADAALDEFRQKLAAMDETDPDFDSLKAGIKEAEEFIDGMNDALNDAVRDGSAFEHVWAKKVDSLMSGLGSLTSKGLGALKEKIASVGRSAKASANGGIDSFFRGIRGIWNIAKMLTIGAGLTGWINATKQGFSNLAAYSASTRGSLETLKSSLLTLKNAFATALAPILDIVAPVLAKVIDWFTAAATAVAQLFSALTGKSVAVVARKATSGIDGVGTSAGNAAGAVDDLKRSLMGFDQINKLEDANAGGGGGGGGGGAGGAGSMFDTVDVDSGMQNLADAIKEAWKDADFTELGRKVGEALKAALDDIPWTEIQEIGAKVGKSIATGLNGFFSTPGLGTSIGNTIAQALNTITITADSFAVNFDWKAFGEFLGESINGFFDNYQFKLLGKTLSDWANGLLETLIKAIDTVKWDNVGSNIVEFLAGIEWGKLFKNASTLIISVANAIYDMLTGAIGKAKGYLETWMKENDLWDVIHDAEKNLTVNVKFFEDLPQWLQDIIEFALKNNPLKLNLKIAGGIADTIEDLKEWFNGEVEDRSEMTIPARFVASMDETFDKVWGWVNGKNGKGTSKDATVNVKGNEEKSFKDAKSNFNSVKTSSATKNVYGGYGKSKWTSSSLKKVKDHFNNDWTKKATKSAYGQYDNGKSWKASSLNKVKTQMDSIKSKSVNVSASATVSSIVVTGTAKQSLANQLAMSMTMRPMTMASGGIFAGGSWKPVTYAAGGGVFGQGEMFVAREAGPELVGTIGGHTSVMNNEQIVSSVAAGVYKAVLSAMSQGSNDKSTTIVLEGDAAKFFKAMQKEARNYVNATGLQPFPV